MKRSLAGAIKQAFLKSHIVRFGGMLVNKTLDALTPSSRSLYESAVVKLVLSIVYGAFAVMFLGFCAEVGGFATSYQKLDKSYLTTGNTKLSDAYNSFTSGYGFSCFCYFVSFILSLAAAITISPLCCGSPNENKILRSPVTFESA